MPLTRVLDTTTIKALQVFVGVAPFGYIGPVTTKALQLKVGAGVDGSVWGYGDADNTTLCLQHCLNSGFLSIGPGSGGTNVSIPESAVTYGLYTAAGTASQWITQAMTAAGVYGSDWSSGLGIICSGESSNNPNAVNDYDSNAWGPIQSDGYPQNCSRGIAQCIPPTFATWHVSGTSNDIYDPISNIAAACLYIIGIYGSIDNVPGVKSVRGGGSYVGY